MVGLGGIILKHMLESKHWRYILVIGVAAGLIVAESWLRRGGPFISGYEGNGAYTTTTVMPYTGKPGFSYPFFFGLLSILFSFGKGLLFFAPGLLLPIRRTILNMREEKKLVLYRAYILWMCFLIGLILVYSRWWAWYGGWFWGPRFFLFASIPASFALAVRLHYRDTSLTLNLLTGIILCLSTWVGIDGAVFGQNLLTGVCLVHNYALETLCHYTPEFSALWHPFVVGEHLDRRQIMYEVYSVLVFAYLAIPLLWEVGSQTIELAGNFGRAHLNFKSWLF
jgi:hypothetical protein